jgi:hypothetical protein
MKGGLHMRRVTQTRILALAISHLTQTIEDGMHSIEEWEAMGLRNEAIYYYDGVVKPDEEALETLKLLYEVETGSPYEKEV